MMVVILLFDIYFKLIIVIHYDYIHEDYYEEYHLNSQNNPTQDALPHHYLIQLDSINNDQSFIMSY